MWDFLHNMDELSPKTVQAGASFQITVTALTAAGKTDPLFADTLEVVSSDPQAAVTAGTSGNGVGTFTVTLKTAGMQTVMVRDLGDPAFKPAEVAVRVTPISIGFLDVTGSGVALPGVAYHFTVTAVDLEGNRIAGYRGTVDFTSSDAGAVLPESYRFTARDQGSHTFTATLNTAGSQSLTATEAGGVELFGPITGSETNIDVTPSTTAITGPTSGVGGQPLMFTLTANENGVSANAVFTYYVNWGDRTPVQVVSGVSGTAVPHAYAGNGTYTIKVIAIDAAGNASPQTATSSVAIQSVLMESDTNSLAIAGAPGADIVIQPADASGKSVNITINGSALPGEPFAPGQLLIFGQGARSIREETQTFGSQKVYVAVPAILFTGTGNGSISAAGSSAANILVGGAGNNMLSGGTGRDILIGGGGKDILQAGSGDDILIAGSTSYAPNVAALLALMSEWSRTDSGYQERVQALFGNGTGAQNGSYLLDQQTVIPNTARDQLFGGAGQDWFWLSPGARAADSLSGFTPGETVTLD